MTDNGGLVSPPATRTITVADFSLSATPDLANRLPGASHDLYRDGDTAAVGFTGTVAFSVTGLPSGATASFSPESVATSGSTTLTVATTPATPPGSYPLTIRGTSGPRTRTVNVTLVVNASNQAPTAIITSPADERHGQSRRFRVVLRQRNRSGWHHQRVCLDVPRRHAGVGLRRRARQRRLLHTGQSVRHRSRVTDNGGLSSASPATRTITVADFSLSRTPTSRTVVQGGATTYTATVTPLSGFTGTVAFSVTGLPSGATASFSPESVATSGSTTLTVATTTATPPGTYALGIRGTSGPRVAHRQRHTRRERRNVFHHGQPDEQDGFAGRRHDLHGDRARRHGLRGNDCAVGQRHTRPYECAVHSDHHRQFRNVHVDGRYAQEGRPGHIHPGHQGNERQHGPHGKCHVDRSVALCLYLADAFSRVSEPVSSRRRRDRRSPRRAAASGTVRLQSQRKPVRALP